MTRALVIKIYSVLTGITGIYALFFFFPGINDCSNIFGCMTYSLCGLFLLLIAVPLFLLKRRAGKILFYFAWFFFALFLYESYLQITTDLTGQGLREVMQLSPVFFLCVMGIIVLPATTAATST